MDLDKTAVLPIQGVVVQANLTSLNLTRRIRRQESFCPFLVLLPKLGETSFLASFESDLQKKLEALLSAQEVDNDNDPEQQAAEISMLKQSLDWLRLGEL